MMLFYYAFHRTIESFRMEKTIKLSEPNHYSNTTKSITKSCPEVPHLHDLNDFRNGNSTTSLGNLFQS